MNQSPYHLFAIENVPTTSVSASMISYYRLLSAHREKGSQQLPVQISSDRFRPNLIVSGGEPYVEDSWSTLRIGGNIFTVSFPLPVLFSIFIWLTQNNKKQLSCYQMASKVVL